MPEATLERILAIASAYAALLRLDLQAQVNPATTGGAAAGQDVGEAAEPGDWSQWLAQAVACPCG